MPYRIQERLRRILVVYLLAGWGLTWAAIEHAGPDLMALPWAQATVACGVSWIGGFAASLGRMLTATYEGKPFRYAHEYGRDAMVSVVIGLAGYWAGMSQQANPALLALTLILAGYAGTRVLATWVDRVVRPEKD